jgi:hypothetical protein
MTTMNTLPDGTMVDSADPTLPENGYILWIPMLASYLWTNTLHAAIDYAEHCVTVFRIKDGCANELTPGLIASMKRSSVARRERITPVTLALCESGRIIPRPGILYRYEVMDGCEACAKLAAAHDD